ncbi:phosphohistidine phosphatase SixA [Synechococcus sp. PCC 6312]|uniref:phosphohistidine phosphatase SixA n=1 Tax=Synechococcus sp. (strain ATCC 27167 / PCC 6312) TaxID=195253 RepID=UPI000318AC7A|nr:phosphohistidine phosphatase SixA [Synechococcus sp. PCC 6312]
MSVLPLYLIRHGIAIDRELFPGPDAERYLTNQGEKKTQQIAERLVDLGVSCDLILSSPLVRAKQTSDILLNAGLADEVQINEALAPGGRFGDWLQWLDQWHSQARMGLALVGHEPDLSQWAELLVWGSSRGVLALKKAGIIGLDVPLGDPVGQSSLFLLTPPRFLLGKVPKP